LKNVSNNLLQQKTSPDFVEWCEEQNFQVDIDFDTKILFEDYKSKYLGEDTNHKQRGFTNWLKLFASINLFSFKTTSSNGKPTFRFSKN
jgi:hypothetical protein